MSQQKQRLTVTVDPELVDAGHRAVQAGEAESVSAWVSTALEEKVRRDHKLRILAGVIADFEREFGEITAEEITWQQRTDRQGATVVRGERRSSPGEARPA